MYPTKQIRNMQVATFEAAHRRFIDKLLGQGFQIKHIFPINNNRYSIIQGTEKTIMFMYKREPFFTFGLMFRNQGHKGIGETINSEDLSKAIQFKVKEIYTCYTTGVVYKIPLKKFLEDSVVWNNKEGKRVRSISIHEFERCFEI